MLKKTSLFFLTFLTITPILTNAYIFFDKELSNKDTSFNQKTTNNPVPEDKLFVVKVLSILPVHDTSSIEVFDDINSKYYYFNNNLNNQNINVNDVLVVLHSDHAFNIRNFGKYSTTSYNNALDFVKNDNIIP